jgi:hypothetical protein
MRHGLGLSSDASPRSLSSHPTTMTNGSHPQRRRFARDGEVPVTVIHRHQNPDAESANQLVAARQAIRSQAAARERAERLLEQAQETIRGLQAQLAHERLAKDEAIERAATETQTVDHAIQTVRAELVAERLARERAEQACRGAQVTIGNLSEKLHAASQALDTAKAELATERRRAVESTGAQRASNGVPAVPTVRRPVGRPRKQAVGETVEKLVEPSAKAKAPAVTKRTKVSEKLDRAAQRPAAKPIRWWLTDR